MMLELLDDLDLPVPPSREQTLREANAIAAMLAAQSVRARSFTAYEAGQLPLDTYSLFRDLANGLEAAAQGVLGMEDS